MVRCLGQTGAVCSGYWRTLRHGAKYGRGGATAWVGRCGWGGWREWRRRIAVTAAAAAAQQQHDAQRTAAQHGSAGFLMGRDWSGHGMGSVAVRARTVATGFAVHRALQVRGGCEYRGAYSEQARLRGKDCSSTLHGFFLTTSRSIADRAGKSPTALRHDRV